MTHTHDTSANQKLLFPRSVRISPRAFPWQQSFILDNIISYSNLGPGTRFSLRATVRHTVFALKCFRRHMSKFARNVKCCSNIAQSAQGCSKCKIVLQTQKSAQKVLSAIGIGLFAVLCHLFTFHTKKPRLSATEFSQTFFHQCHYYIRYFYQMVQKRSS